MHVLVIGGGGREHALVWALAKSPKVQRLSCIPGNAGIAALAECPAVADKTPEALAAWAEQHGVDLTVVGPEDPLAAGIVDLFTARGLVIFGPTAAAAQIEASKSFAKDLMVRHGVPTAAHATFTEPGPAIEWVRALGAPVVVKADGLAAGKGVIVTETEAEAIAAIERMLTDRPFGAASARIVLEERLFGPELSVFFLCDGERARLFGAARDYKRVFDRDSGPNTGGMGSVSPVPGVTGALLAEIEACIAAPVVRALREAGRPYRGFLFAGLMLTETGPKVIEFNCRFGDPEAQALFARWQGDLVAACQAAVAGDVSRVPLEWDPRAAVCVVLASGGYPGPYRTGLPIAGLKEAAAQPDTLVFHAGTRAENGRVVTAGGRVLNVVGVGETIEKAAERAYAAAARIRWEGVHYRRDIARAGSGWSRPMAGDAKACSPNVRR